MPISKIPIGAIESGTISTSQIADNAVTTAKILNDNVTSAKIPNDAISSTEIAASAVTRDELQSAAVNNISSDSIILNSTNGTADAGDFLVLDGTDGSSSNANHRILFDETFVDKVGLFNINTLGSAGQALKVDTGGTGLEFGSAGGLVKISSTTANDVSSVEFTELSTETTYSHFKLILDNVTASSDNTAIFYAQFGTGGASPTYYTSSKYQSVGVSSYAGVASMGQHQAYNAAQMNLGYSTSSGYCFPGNTFEYLSGTIKLFRFADANHQPSIVFQFHAPVSGNVEQSMAGSGSVVQSASFGNATAFRLYLSSGNINGIFTLYGVVK